MAFLNYFKYHMLALLIGTVLDLIIGDPYSLPHPIRLIGRWIAFWDKRLLGEKTVTDKRIVRIKGFFLCFIVILPAFLIVLIITRYLYEASATAGVIWEAVLSFYFLAAKSLYTESDKVLKAYNSEGIVAARKALSMIVGRDTDKLTINEIYKATIETIAENASDGVFAPLFYMIIFGPVGGVIYKSINTMDSMVGYHNDRYEDFGFCAAKLDDIANFIPSRLTGLFTVVVSFIFRRTYDYKNSWRIFKRDRLNHKSPNSAQSEAAFAGALNLQLGGGAYYFGSFVAKPTIGDAGQIIEERDVKRAQKLLINMVLVSQVLLCMVVIFTIIR